MLHYAICFVLPDNSKHEYSNTVNSLPPKTYHLSPSLPPPGILFMSVENQAKAYALEVEDGTSAAFAIRRQKLLRQIFKLRKISLDFFGTFLGNAKKYI